LNIVECVQKSPEWFAAKVGKVGASEISDVLSRDRSGKGEGAMRRNLKAKVVCEILTGLPQGSGFQSKGMEDGIENEPFACSAYEVSKEVMVDKVGFVLHPTIPRFGASPDGLVLGADGKPAGVLEIKCGYPTTHIAWLRAGVVPTEHQPQMLAEMSCTELPWTDFVSYCPALPTNLQLFVVRFLRDEARIKEMEAQIRVFFSEVDEMVAELLERAA
jgi:hypothetical protein